MCMKCDGMTDEEIREHYLSSIENFGWAVCAVEGGRGRLPFAYTVGLTRLHDHPEILVSGLEDRTGMEYLNTLGERVRAGSRFHAGMVLPEGAHRTLFVRVNGPERLVVAQEIYRLPGGRPVPALQAVWSDHEGRWPWQPGSAHGRTSQLLFGRPRPQT